MTKNTEGDKINGDYSVLGQNIIYFRHNL